MNSLDRKLERLKLELKCEQKRMGRMTAIKPWAYEAWNMRINGIKLRISGVELEIESRAIEQQRLALAEKHMNIDSGLTEDFKHRTMRGA